MKIKHVFLIIISAVLISYWIAFSAGTFFILALSFFTYFCMRNFLKKEDRKFVLTLFLLSLIFRLVLSTGYYLCAYSLRKGVDFFGDARGYSNNAAYISYVIRGNDLNSFPYTDNSGINSLADSYNYLLNRYKGALPPFSFRIDGLVYFIGFLYSIFDYSPLMVKWLNCLFFTLAGIILYFIAKQIFNSRTSRAGVIALLLWPSNFLWSISGLKESVTFLLLVCCIWSMLKFFNKRRFVFFLSFAASLTVIWFIRIHLAVSFMVTFIILSFFRLRNSQRLMTILFIFIMFLFFVSVFNLDIPQILSRIHKEFFANTIGTNRAILTIRGAQTYRIYPARFSEPSHVYDINCLEFLTSLFKGLFFFLTVPLPWMITKSKFFLIVFPQVMIWYLLLPFSILGGVVALRYRFREAIVVASQVFLITILFSLVEANVGTAFRHRDILMPFYIIFAMGGIFWVFGKKELGIRE
ncbi:MAG: glycosyltransferase family 39 protein [Candidatus Omnitrophota bacterium]